MKDDITSTLAETPAAPLGLEAAFEGIGIDREPSTTTGPVGSRLRSVGAAGAVLIALVVLAVVLALTEASAVMDALGRIAG